MLVDYERYEELLQGVEDLIDRLSLETAAEEPARSYADFMVEMDLNESDPA